MATRAHHHHAVLALVLALSSVAAALLAAPAFAMVDRGSGVGFLGSGPIAGAAATQAAASSSNTGILVGVGIGVVVLALAAVILIVTRRRGAERRLATAPGAQGEVVQLTRSVDDAERRDKAA